MSRTTRSVLLLCTVGLLVWLGGLYARTWLPPGIGPQAGWRNSWDKWDAPLYRELAKIGYIAQPQLIAFAPGYSRLIGALGKVSHLTFTLVALLVNLASLWFWSVLFCRFGRDHFQLHPGLCCVWFYSMPTNYFALTSYSDCFFNGLYWLLIVTCLDTATCRRWVLVLLSLVLPWIRLTAYSLASLVVRPGRRLASAAVLCSLLLWLAYNQYWTGSPWYFLSAQQKFGMPPGGLYDGMRASLSALSDPRDLDDIWKIAVFPMVSLAVCLASCLWLARKRCVDTALVLATAVVLSHNQAFWRSTVRYDWLCHPVVGLPLLVGLTAAARARRWREFSLWCALTALVVGFNIHQQGWLAYEFQNWRWAY